VFSIFLCPVEAALPQLPVRPYMRLLWFGRTAAYGEAYHIKLALSDIRAAARPCRDKR